MQSVASIITLTGYVVLPLAWHLNRLGRWRSALLVLVVSGTLLRLGPSLDPVLHPWDERYHALVAKNLMHDPLRPALYADEALPHDDANWTRAHIWLHKPPFGLWCIALALKALGLHPWAVRVPSLLFSMLAVALCHHLGRLLFNTTTAFWSALLFAINGHLIELASGRTSTDHVDAILTALVLSTCVAAFHMARTGKVAWAMIGGGLLGLSFLTKSLPALLGLAVACTALVSFGTRRKALLLLVFGATAALVVLPWEWYAYSAFAQHVSLENTQRWAHFTTSVEEHARPWYYYLVQLTIFHGELVPVALLSGAVYSIRHKQQLMAPLLVWLIAPLVIFSFAASKMPGYMAIASPAIGLLAGHAVSRWTTTGADIPWRMVARTGAALLVLLPLRFSWDRTQPFGQQAAYPALPVAVAHASRGDVIVGCPDPIDVMFKTSAAAAYGFELDSATLTELRNKGYRVIAFDEP